MSYDDVFKNLPQILDYVIPSSYLDIGANKGWHIPYVLFQLPSIKTLELIEASRSHEADLKELTKDRKIPYRIEVLSDSVKEVKFYTDQNPNRITAPGNSYYKDRTSAFHDFSFETRITNTLDNLYPTKSFDLIKLDTQGSELDIIKGGLKLISRAKALIIEESITQNYQGAPLDKDNRAFLETQGFVFVKHLAWFGHWVKDTEGNNFWHEEADALYVKKEYLNKLSISVGILAWHSGETLENSLRSYLENGLLEIVDDVTIFFQETTEEDKILANQYNISYIESKENVGIGQAFVKLAENAKHENILLLEHDWELTIDPVNTKHRLQEALKMLDLGYHSVRLRNRRNPGFPVFTIDAYYGKELSHFCPIIQLQSPHLMDCVHWIENPDQQFPEQIQTDNYHYVTTSRWSNWTNNPCLYRKDFYINTVQPFLDTGDKLLENSISAWWARQNFKIAWGEALFTHKDVKKYGR